MDYDSYYAARPNEKKLMDIFDECEPDWKQVATSLLEWISDDDVAEWARVNDYDLENDQDKI